jgi:hypothetical protein
MVVNNSLTEIFGCLQLTLQRMKREVEMANEKDKQADSPSDPKENPVGTGHLPVSGEVGVGPVSYHDPLTIDTNDDPDAS